MATLTIAVILFIALVPFSTTANLPKNKPNVYSLLWRSNLPPPPRSAVKSHRTHELNFTQRLNHFDSAYTRTWQQRYFTNDDHYQPGGPAFMMIGGEGPIDESWMTSGQWIVWARQHHAYLFQLEHRFYGFSQPFENLSTANLRYLNSEQALADLAYFRVTIAEQLQLTDAKWMFFGCSYPGTLAAWFMLKYPHLATGAVGCSGPVVAKANFPEYLKVVVDAMNAVNPDCVPAMQAVTDQMEKLLSSGNESAVQYVSNLFQ